MVHRDPAIIRSRQNPLVRRLMALKSRTSEELLLIEGCRLLDEALDAGIEISEAAVSFRFQKSDRARRLLPLLEDRGVDVRSVHENVLASLSELTTSEGVLAIGRRPHFSEAQLYRSPPLILVAAEIQSPGNLGGLLRTAEAAGSTGAYVSTGTADPLSWKALRGSMGSAFRLPHVQGLTLHEILRRLKARGVVSVAGVPRASTSYAEADLRGPLAFIFGSEGAGLRADALRDVDLHVSIPMHRPVESLNVGVAAGILFFEAARQRAEEARRP